MKIHIYEPDMVIPEGDIAVRLGADSEDILAGIVALETVDSKGCHGSWLCTFHPEGIVRNTFVEMDLGFSLDEHLSIKDITDEHEA